MYKGYFQNDEFHGSGILEMKGSRYEGNFEEGKYAGRGKAHIKSQNGSIDYEGDFRNGLFDGNGKIKYSNGDTYEG